VVVAAGATEMSRHGRRGAEIGKDPDQRTRDTIRAGVQEMIQRAIEVLGLVLLAPAIAMRIMPTRQSFGTELGNTIGLSR